MEQTLNLVWACVAIAGILAQLVMLSRAAASAERTASSWRKIVAMGCVLVILFFVISMTDDLHDQAILFEEKKPSRILSEITRPTLSPSQEVSFVFLLFFSNPSVTPDLTAARRPLDPRQARFTPAVVNDGIEGRAPPLPLA